MTQTNCFFFDDRALSGAYAHLAFHGDSSLPAIGGIRVFPYHSIEVAKQDAQALAACMAVKASTHDLPLGGAKMVCTIPHPDHRQAFFERLAHFIDQFKGQYIAAMDSGITTTDMDTIHAHTPFVCNGSSIGSPAPYTAKGVYQCIMAINAHRFEQSPEALSVSLIGAGAVGTLLIDQLKENRIQSLLVAESNPTQRNALADRVNCVPTNALLQRPCDILSPCATGHLITRNNLPKLRCRAIVGAANNPLAPGISAQTLHDQGIIYLPDTISNAGGLIFCAASYFQEPSRLEAIDQIPIKAIKYIEQSQAILVG